MEPTETNTTAPVQTPVETDRVQDLEMLIMDFVLGLVGAEINSPQAETLSMTDVTLVMTAMTLAGARLFEFNEDRNLDPFIRFGIVSYYHTHQANLATALQRLSEESDTQDMQAMLENLNLDELMNSEPVHSEVPD